jgi:hypothetical protein
MNEQRTGAPLTASVGEQLSEKAHVDAAREEERRAGVAAERRVERKKVEEREAAMRHAVLGRRAPRTPGRGHARWPIVLGAVVAFAAIYGFARLVRRR